MNREASDLAAATALVMFIGVFLILMLGATP